MTRVIPEGQVAVTACFDSFSQAQTIISALDLFRLTNADDYELGTLRRWTEAVYAVTDGTPVPCLDVPSNNGTCFRMDTTTELFQFYPNNPFDSTDTETTSTGMSWVRLGDVVEETPEWLQTALDNVADFVGYFENDCFIAYNIEGNAFQDLVNRAGDFLNALRDGNLYPFPIVSFDLEGAGQVEIEFCQVPLGGSVLVVWDYEPLVSEIIDFVRTGDVGNLINFQVVELDRDVIQVPPELVSTNIFEHEFTEDTAHRVQCFFFPTLDKDLPFIFPFAGIREVEFCGVSAIGSETGNTYNQYKYKDSGSIRRGMLPAVTYIDYLKALRQHEREKAIAYLMANPENLRSGIEIDVPKVGGDPEDYKFDIELIGLTGGLPSQQIDGVTNQEVLYGQALQVGYGFRELVAELVSWESNGVTMDTIVQRIAQFYKFGFGIDLNSTFVTDFRDDLSTLIASATVNATPVVDPVAIANLVYCNGNNKQSLYRYALDVEENGAVDPVAVANFYRLLIDNLEDSQLTDWYEDPASEPSFGFTQAPCYRFPAQKMTVNGAELQTTKDHYFDVAWEISTVSRKVELRFSGEIQLSGANGTYNGVFVTASNGSEVFARFDAIMVNGGNTTFRQFVASDVKIVEGALVVTKDLTQTLGQRFAGIRFMTTYDNTQAQSDSFTVQVIDKGE